MTIVCLALALHAGLLWVLSARTPGQRNSAAALDLTFVDPAAIPVTLPTGGFAAAAPGGRQAPGDRISQAPAETGEGDGTRPEGQGGMPEARAQAPEEATTTAVAAGEAAENRLGQGGPFADGPLGLAANNAYQRRLLRHIRPFRQYPSEAVTRRAEGVVVVRFRVSRGGQVEEAWVAKRSRDPALDRAALDTLWRAEPMPAVPDNLPDLKQLFGTTNQEFAYGVEDIARYYRTYLDLMRHWNEVLPGRVLRVHYEDVVEDLEGGVRRMLDHCGLPFEPACLAFHETRRSVRTPSSEQVRQPIGREGLDQWRNYASWLEPLRDALGDAVAGYRD